MKMKLRFPQADSLTEPYWASASRGELSFPRCVACDPAPFLPASSLSKLWR